MENKEKKSNEKIEFAFPFKKFERMAEIMKNCCPGEGGMTDCCAMTRKMMQCDEQQGKKKETGETGEGKSER